MSSPTGFDKIAYSERKNYDPLVFGCVSDWREFGINPDDATGEALQNNYVELLNKYGDKILYILVVFAFSDINSIIKQLRQNKMKKLEPSYCKMILSKIKNIDNLLFKNPYLIILGFYINNPDKSINIERLNQAIDIIEEVDSYKLYPPDLIRYQRMWKDIL